MTRALRVTAIAVGLIALAIAATAFAIEKSLPYRIGPDNYARYLWVGRLSIAALIACLFAISLGITCRQRLPVILGACSMLAWLLFIPGGVHSGARPETWCYSNLRWIDAAKERLSHRSGLTNGSSISAAEISPLIEGGFQSLKCYMHGVYIIGPVGTEPRCSVHGSLSEIGGDTPRKSQ
jgi:hypothetical protein